MSTSHGHHDALAHTHDAPDAPDAWHVHTTDEPLPQQAHTSEVDSHRTILYGTVGFIIIVVATVATWEYFKSYTTQLRIQREEQVDMHVKALEARTKTLAELRAGPADHVASDGSIQVPISVASQRVMEKYGK
jgi:hypothetical protein